jgi:DNA-nicking Smr family endonuclease
VVKPPPSKVDEEDKRLFAESMKKMDVRFEDEIPDVHPLRPVAVNRMRQLKSGAIRIDLELDLHGMTRDEALESMKRFITGAFNRGQKAVLVITGKGNNSVGEPVLQAAVMSWLRETGKDGGIAPAPQQLGGSGAPLLFLKDKDKATDKTAKDLYFRRDFYPLANSSSVFRFNTSLLSNPQLPMKLLCVGAH